SKTLMLAYDGAVVRSYADRIKSIDPHSYWRMEQIAGGVVNDGLNSGLSATAFGGVSLSGASLAPDPGGNSISLTGGAGGFLQVSGAGFNGYNFLHDGQPFSICAWIQLDNHLDTSTGHFIFGTSATLADVGGVFYYDNTGAADRQLSYFISAGNDTDSIVVASNAGAITDNLPHHVAMTSDGSTVIFYVDGIAQGTADISSFTFPVGDAEALPQIGAANSTGLFTGDLDEVAVFDKLISASQVDLIATISLADTYKAFFRARPNQGETGLWNYSITSTDTDLNGQSGSFTVVAGTGNEIELTPDGQHVVDHNGNVRQMIFAGINFDICRENELDELIVIGADRATPRDVLDFLAQKKFSGIFTTALVWEDLAPPNITVKTYITIGTEFDLTYWKRIDRIYEYAAEKGLALRQWMYSDDENAPTTAAIGWDTDGTSNTLSAMDTRLFDYFLARFGSLPGVFVDSGVDLTEFRNDAWAVNYALHFSNHQYFNQGLWVGSRHGLQTLGEHPPAANFYSDDFRDIPSRAHQLNMFQNDVVPTQPPTWSLVPAMNMDRNDEGSQLPNPVWPVHQLRYTQWQYMLSGMVGFAVGDEDASSDSDFGGYISINTQLFDHADHNEIAQNFVENNLTGDPKLLLANDVLLTATGNQALANNGINQYIAWVEDGQQISVDLTAGGANSYTGTWVNPRDGTTQPIAGNTVDGGALRNITSPTQVVGDDWVLMLNRVLAQTAQINEGFDLSSDVARQASFSASMTTDLATSDTESRVAQFNAMLMDNAQYDDTVSAVQMFFGLVSSDLASSSTILRSAQFSATVVEGLVKSDQDTATRAVGANVDEILSSSSTVLLLGQLMGILSTSLDQGDDWAAQVAALGVLTHDLSQTDQIFAQTQTAQVGIITSDLQSASEFIATAAAISSISESWSFSDVILASSQIMANISEDLTLVSVVQATNVAFQGLVSENQAWSAMISGQSSVSGQVIQDFLQQSIISVAGSQSAVVQENLHLHSQIMEAGLVGMLNAIIRINRGSC
ncbi:MAG: LamG-like jellyroll fold domain-containing protein, partial [Gammaproteobacteria bacterium]